VDIRHYPQLSENELTNGVLAQLLRYGRQGTVLKSGRPDFYRICLYDPLIISAVERENLPLASLLNYILTHEFVHVARFIKFMKLFNLETKERFEEEAMVHKECQRLLARLNLLKMDHIFSLYRDHLLPLDNLTEFE
jgi:hypothetical protein